MNYLWIALGIAALVILFISLSKKSKAKAQEELDSLPKPLDLNEPANWTNEEFDFISDLNIYRHDLGLSLIVHDDKMKILSQGRVKMWILDKVNIRNLHDGFKFHSLRYLKQGYAELDELAQAGYTGYSILQKYKLSSNHNSVLIDPAIKSGAITI